MNIRQLTKTHWYIGESLVSFRQFGECTRNSRQHILWTFAICECPVGESLIGEIRVSRFSQNWFLDKALYWDTGNDPLMLSDRFEISTTDSLNYSPRVLLAVFIFDRPIRIHRVSRVNS